MSKYNIGDRVSFMVTVGADKSTHYVGYVKKVARILFGYKYAIVVAKTDTIFLVPEKHIFGIVEKKINNIETK